MAFDDIALFVLFMFIIRCMRSRRRLFINREHLRMQCIEYMINWRRRQRRRLHRQFVRRHTHLSRSASTSTVFLMTLLLRAPLTFRVNRTIWTRVRSRTWWEEVVMGSWGDAEWVENFRMTKATFRYLCNRLQNRIHRVHTRLCLAVSVDRRIAITLWRLSTNCEYRTIGHLFGVARSTACEIFRETCQVIREVLLKEVIQFPTQRNMQNIVDGFRVKWGFPQVGGAIDGTHIPILAPELNPSDYFNRKGFYSIILQAISDDNYCFTNVCVGWAGSVHDARVFSNSGIFRKLQQNNLFPNTTENISGVIYLVDVPLVLLGDPAYPLLPNLMKPFSDNGRLTPEQNQFNKRLSSARIVIENAFGRLKGRWRCLLKRNDCNLDFIPTIISACCILHNLCELHRNPFNDRWLEGVDDFEGPNDNGNVPDDITGTIIRQAILEHFQNE